MGGATLPPGFRFHPTDEELVGYYLWRNVEGLEIELEVIPVIDFCKFDPWELPDKSFLPKREMEWFFFCPRDKKYSNGSRTNRATRAGYWKATGKDRKVVCESSITGYRKTLVFYKGRAPLGNRTDWVMHEYRLCDDNSSNTNSGVRLSHCETGTFALCRVVKKSGFHDEVKARKIRSCSSNNNHTTTKVSNEHSSMCSDYHHNGSNYSTSISSPYITPQAEFDTVASMGMGTDSPSIWVSPDMILDSSKEYAQIQERQETGSSSDYYQNDFHNAITPWQPPYQQGSSSSSSHSNFTEVEHIDDLNRIGCFSPCSSSMDYMGSWGNAHKFYTGYDNVNSVNYQNPFGQ